MAKTPEKAFELLNKLWDAALPNAKKEVVEMQKIIDKKGGKFNQGFATVEYLAASLLDMKLLCTSFPLGIRNKVGIQK